MCKKKTSLLSLCNYIAVTRHDSCLAVAQHKHRQCSKWIVNSHSWLLGFCLSSGLWACLPANLPSVHVCLFVHKQCILPLHFGLLWVLELTLLLMHNCIKLQWEHRCYLGATRAPIVIRARFPLLTPNKRYLALMHHRFSSLLCKFMQENLITLTRKRPKKTLCDVQYWWWQNHLKWRQKWKNIMKKF